MIIYKKEADLRAMRKAGLVVARALKAVEESIVPGKSTPKMLDAIARRIIEEAGAKPSFLGYRGFPASACISVNEAVVHGIPDDRTLVEGDIVSVDLGAFLEGYHGDSAWTFPVGTISKDAQRLLNVTRESLFQGIAKAKMNNRIGDVSAAVQKYVEGNGYGVVREMVGHGIGRSLHEEPSVPNFGRAGTGPVIRDGMTFCIEPMVNQGTYQIVTLNDGWTTLTKDGLLSAHFEHSIAVTRSGVIILTAPEGEDGTIAA